MISLLKTLLLLYQQPYQEAYEEDYIKVPFTFGWGNTFFLLNKNIDIISNKDP